MINTPAKKINNFSQKRTEYVIGALGRFVPEKGFNYLIEAISILRDRKYRVKLLIGGAGPLEIQLKKLAHGLNIGKNIEFIGWINDKESFFKTVDIFCIPSVFETFGIFRTAIRIIRIIGCMYSKKYISDTSYFSKS